MRILLVDDDRSLSDALTESLRELHYTVDAVEDGEDAWSYGSTFDYDLVILDWMIPSVDGITLCRRFREHGSHVPILLMTARNSCTDKVVGLDSGADDYVIKPFDFEELLARIRALLRRNNDRSALKLTWGKLELDPRSCEVSFERKPLTLTATEYALLELFLRRKTHTFSIESIIDNLWPSGSYPAKATVRSHVRGLRNKLKAAGATSNIIQTVSGIGYRLQTKAKSLPVNPRLARNCQNTFEQQRERADMLATVWKKHKTTHLNNLSIVEQYLNSPDKLNQKQASHCRSILHTLSGTLGTFGLTAASQLSAELEELWPTISDEKALLSQRGLPIIDAIKTELERPIMHSARSENCADDANDSPGEDDGRGKHRLIIVGCQNALVQVVRASILSCTNRVEAMSLPGLEETEKFFRRQSISSTKICHFNERTILIVLPDVAEFEGRNPKVSVPILERLFEYVPNLKIFLIQPDTKDLQFSPQAGLTRLFTQCEVCDRHALLERVLQCFNIVEDNLTVLAIDDDPLFLKTLESILRPSGFNVVTVSDRVDFWSTLSATNPSLLILDIEMPYVNGLELCQTIRRHPQWIQLPVMFVSAHTDSNTQHAAFSIGADDYIAKPIEGDRLITRILNRLARVNGYRVPTAA